MRDYKVMLKTSKTHEYKVNGMWFNNLLNARAYLMSIGFTKLQASHYLLTL